MKSSLTLSNGTAADVVVAGSTVLCFEEECFGDGCSVNCAEVPIDGASGATEVLCEVVVPETRRRLPATELGSHSRTVRPPVLSTTCKKLLTKIEKCYSSRFSTNKKVLTILAILIVVKSKAVL